MPEKPPFTVFVCSHCGDRYRSNIGMYCHNCSTAQKRKDMDIENRKIHLELGVKTKYTV